MNHSVSYQSENGVSCKNSAFVQTSEIVVLDDERETEREEAAEHEVGETAPIQGEQVRYS